MTVTALDSKAVSSTASLTVSVGRPTGSGASRRLRAEEQIPAVLYGHGMDPVTLSVARRDLRIALSGPAGVNTILTLDVNGKSYPAIVKELQRHPVRRTVSHVDFLQIDLSEEITVAVPLRLEGTAKAVVANGGLVDAAVDSIELRCTPANMPNEIVIDITDMTTETVIHLTDVVLPAGTTATGDPDMLIVTVLTLRQDTAAPVGEGESTEEEGGAEAPAASTESSDESAS
jgi:large subunit ribosomal protein L25